MKIGVKTYKEFKFADYFKDKADFLEIMAMPKKDFSFLSNYPAPIVIHCAHNGFGVNFADRNLKEKNFEAIEKAKELADKFNSKKIIIHPGRLDNKNCSIENSISCVKDLDGRFVVENLGGESFCRTPKEMRDFLERTNKNFCFDFNHAIVSSDFLGLDCDEMINEFIEMKPMHFHLSGQRKDNLKEDSHLSFEDSDFDFTKYLRKLPTSSEITLEVTQDIEKTERDLEYIRRIIK